MAHRARHRHAALVRRVSAGRMTKGDQTPNGLAAWEAVRDALTQGILKIVQANPGTKLYDKDLKEIPTA